MVSLSVVSPVKKKTPRVDERLPSAYLSRIIQVDWVRDVSSTSNGGYTKMS
jgi:hypothetical protein